MTTIRVAVEITAPPERCFDLARDVDLHVQSAAHTRERAVGGITTGLLNLGDTVTRQAVHLGLPWRLTAQITRYDRLFLTRHLRNFLLARARFLQRVAGNRVSSRPPAAAAGPRWPSGLAAAAR